MHQKWIDIIQKLDFAFQPIIHTNTGKTFAFEILLQDIKKASNFDTEQELFDYAFEDEMIYYVHQKLLNKALNKFLSLEYENIPFFYNLDHRLIYLKNKHNDIFFSNLHFSKKNIIFQFNEKGSLCEQNLLLTLIDLYKKNHYKISINHFGNLAAGLKLLYFGKSDYIKIDKFYIHNINSNPNKRFFCSSITEIAHILGIKIIAQQVETKEEYYTCKEINIDYIQGPFIQKATKDIDELKYKYNHIINTIKKDKRKLNHTLIDEKYIQNIQAININSSLHKLFIYFKENPSNTFVPIIDDYNYLQGVIYEVDIKKISYSQYGLSLSKNIACSSNLIKFIKPILCAERTWSIDKILEIYSMNQIHSKGIFITQGNKYIGFINVNSLLILSYNRNLEIAKNQNPLTKLPGNKQIEMFIEKAFQKNISTEYSHIMYFDFNDFKPFNDIYGFRQGDRAILIFSELLQSALPHQTFIAHVGGDDFFVGFNNQNYETIYKIVKSIQEQFIISVEALYSKEDIRNKYIVAIDRFNTERKFNLLSVSCAIIEISSKSNKLYFDHNLGLIKKVSKSHNFPIGICM